MWRAATHQEGVECQKWRLTEARRRPQASQNYPPSLPPSLPVIHHHNLPFSRYQEKENERLAIEAEVARQREVSRAVKTYVDTSEARRKEEHGAGPDLDELIRRKKVQR